MTEVSVVQAKYNDKSQDVEVSVVHNENFQRGGDDITNCLSQKHVIPFIPAYSETNFKLKKRIEDSVEKAKIALTGNAFTKVTIESALGQQKDFTAEITRDMVDQCVDELYKEEDIQHFQNVAFHIDPDFGDDSTFYLFYGGSSRVPRL